MASVPLLHKDEIMQSDPNLRTWLMIEVPMLHSTCSKINKQNHRATGEPKHMAQAVLTKFSFHISEKDLISRKEYADTVQLQGRE